MVRLAMMATHESAVYVGAFRQEGKGHMTTVFDCVQDIIAKAPKFLVRSSAVTSGPAATEWEPTTLLNNMRQIAPAVLDDPTWTEWSLRPSIGANCFIHYGVRGYSLGHIKTPGYGNLRALELDQNGHTNANENGGDARASLSRLLGC